MGQEGSHDCPRHSWEITAVGPELNADDVESVPNPHANADADQVAAENSEDVLGGDESSARIGRDEGVKIMERNIRITKKDLVTYGYTPHCPRCMDIESGCFKTNRHQTDECRVRLHPQYDNNNDPKWRAVESAMPSQPKPSLEKEELRLEAQDSSITTHGNRSTSINTQVKC